MKKHIIVLSFLFLAVLTQSALAQIFTDKTKIEMKAEPGETSLEKITIYNTTQEEMDLKIYWEDFVYISPFDGTKDFLPVGNSPYSLSSAVSFSPQEIKLAPNGNAQVSVSIQLPEESKGGGYYGVLFYEKKEPTIAPGTGVKIVTRLGTLFFIETKWKDKSVDIKDFKAADHGIEGTFVNKGNIFLLPRGTFYVLGTDGMVADRGEVNKLYLTPGAEGKLSLKFSEKLAEGKYTAVITFDLKDGDSATREADFVKKSDGTIEIMGVRE